MPKRALTRKVTLVAATDAELLPENPLRVYALIVNNSAVLAYLEFGKAAVVDDSPRLNADGGSYEINLTNPWQGSLHAISAGVPVISVREW